MLVRKRWQLHLCRIFAGLGAKSLGWHKGDGEPKSKCTKETHLHRLAGKQPKRQPQANRHY